LTAVPVAVNANKLFPLVSKIEVPILGEVRVLLVKVSVPARVARVPVVGKVTLVAPVVVKVKELAPDVIKLEPSAKVKVAELAGAVTVTLL